MRQDSTDNANYESTYVELARLETCSKCVLALQCWGICIFFLCLCQCSSGTPTVLRHAHTEFGKFYGPFEWMRDDPLRFVFLSLAWSSLSLNRRVVGTVLCMCFQTLGLLSLILMTVSQLRWSLLIILLTGPEGRWRGGGRGCVPCASDQQKEPSQNWESFGLGDSLPRWYSRGKQTGLVINSSTVFVFSLLHLLHLDIRKEAAFFGGGYEPSSCWDTLTMTCLACIVSFLYSVFLQPCLLSWFCYQ